MQGAAVKTPAVDQLLPLGELRAPGDLLSHLEGVFPVNAVLLPDPYRELLAHERDMTSTLEAFHGERVVLRVLARRHHAAVGAAPEALYRQVLLAGENSGQVHELGAIKIVLSRVSPQLRRHILLGQQPLGALLESHRVDYVSQPAGFFRMLASPAVVAVLGLSEPRTLYGRHNLLLEASGAVLAEVVEILPPGPRGAVGGPAQR